MNTPKTWTWKDI